MDETLKQRLALIQKFKPQFAAILKMDESAITKAIQQTLWKNHELGSGTIVLLKPGSLPRTSSGKLQRLACGEAHANQTWTPLNAITQEDKCKRHQ